MLKLIVIVVALFWLARLVGRFIPRIEISVDSHGSHGSDEIMLFHVMREHFPTRYEQYKAGLLSDTDERRLYLDCLEILGARQEIERL